MNSVPMSVLIITYRRQVQLKKCVDSLFHQSIFPKEIVIVNNDCTDQLRTLIAPYQHISKKIKISYYENSKNNVPRARNIAMKKAQYNCVAFIDDDCIAHHDWVKTGYISHIQHPYSIVCGKNNNARKTAYIASCEHKMTERHFAFYRKRVEGTIYSRLLDTKNCVLNRHMMLARKILFDEEMKRLEDVDLSYSLLHKKISIIYAKEMRVQHHYQNNIVQNMGNSFLIGYYNAKIERKWKSKVRMAQFHTKSRKLDRIMRLYRILMMLVSYLGYYVFLLKKYLLFLQYALTMINV